MPKGQASVTGIRQIKKKSVKEPCAWPTWSSMKSTWTKMKYLSIYFYRDSRPAFIYHLTSHHMGSHLLHTSPAVLCIYCSSDFAVTQNWYFIKSRKKALIHSIFSPCILEGCYHYLAFHAVLCYPKQSFHKIMFINLEVSRTPVIIRTSLY